MGADLELTLYGGHAMRQQTLPIEAPTRAGEKREVTVVWDQEFGRVVGRALWEDGTPVREQTLFGTLVCNGVAGGASTLTDEEGHFEMPLGQEFKSGVRTAFLRTERNGVPAEVLIDLSFLTPPGTTRIEDVVVTELPCLVAGQVVDGQGLPVKEVSLTLDLRAEDGEWARQYGKGRMTDADGNFAMWGAWGGGEEARVTAWVDGEEVDEVVVVIGDRSLVLRVP